MKSTFDQRVKSSRQSVAHRNESGRRRSGHDEGQPDPVSMHIQVTG
ncbi:hypothetical protein [Burkholderia stabilis]|nr:hypothetical protein [Burkholderia stabilis]